MQNLKLGKAKINPSKAQAAGSFITLTYTYTSDHPIDDTGYVKIAFRYAGDFGTPQFTNPSGENYCSIRTTGDCRIEPRWDPKGHTRPWGRSIFLKVTQGFLGRGEKIVVVFGDRTGGSPGWQVQTFCERSFEFKTLVDPIATYEFKELPTSPVMRIVPGRPVRAVCVAPSMMLLNSRFTYHLKLEDRWGNPVRKPNTLRHSGFSRTGNHHVEARDGRTGLSAKSNPIRVVQKTRGLRPFWADLHGQSEETLGTNTIEDYFTFARDFGLLDLSAHQGNDFQITDCLWETVNRVSKKFYVPGRFVTFPGYEWSGNTPLGGDRNVYFASEGGEIVHSSADLLPGKRSIHPTASTAKKLFAALRSGKGPEVFAFAHAGGRYADMTVHDREVEAAVEVHSAWGTFEWLVEDALRLGYRIGVCANSDGHKGRPGASYPGARKFGSFGGLTCILAEKLHRKSILKALRRRHFYATTGNRCLLDVELDKPGGPSAMMGDVIHMGEGVPRLRVNVQGTAPIESVEVRNGTETMKTLRPYRQEDLGSRIKVVWSGAEVRGRARMVNWDGRIRIRGNSIRSFVPVNFWNPRQAPCSKGKNRIEWKSVTTGGHAGLILELNRPNAGTLEIHTTERNVKCAVESLGLEPRAWNCGGLRKRISIHRLPDQQDACSYSFEIPIPCLRKGDNAIHVRVDQEDGHAAWSSPIYIVSGGSR